MGVRHSRSAPGAAVRLAAGLVLFWAGAGLAASRLTDGPLRLEVVADYSLVVDSNVESTNQGPRAAYLGARIFNDGDVPLLLVQARIGDLTDADAWEGTPGTYPVTTVAPGVTTYSGSFSLTHQPSSGAEADATRSIAAIAPGEYVPVYWLVSYPVMDANGEAVTGRRNDLTDDLVLRYDVWVEAANPDTGQPLRVYDECSLTCRSEISASANNIWPNNANKVPPEYLDALLQLGWRTDAPYTTPGPLVVEGIWFSLGNIGAGYDYDGDGVPDYGVWLQPVGDPDAYDASAFRLVHCYGMLIVTRSRGGEKVILFEDQLYFKDMPMDAVSAVGLIYYEFVALRPGVSATLNPYQNVASGGTGKYNADYGRTISVPQPAAPEFHLDKSASPPTVQPGEIISYEIAGGNDSAGLLEDVSTGNRLCWKDSIPAGTRYVAGSAAGNNTPPETGPETRVLVYYSTDGGLSWLDEEPTDPAAVTDLQWRLDQPLQPGAEAVFRFQVTVPEDYGEVYVRNCVWFGSSLGSELATDCVTTGVNGSATVSGTVFHDSDRDGELDNGETGLASIRVWLYLDLDEDGELDDTDPLWASLDSGSDGAYSFGYLPDAAFLVVVDDADSDLPAGYVLTTLDTAAVTVSGGGTYRGRNFGFAPVLALDKALAGSDPVYEGDLVTYTITVRNQFRQDLAGVETVEVTTWAASLDTRYSMPKPWTNPENALGEPDGVYAIGPVANTPDYSYVTGFAAGAPAGRVLTATLVLPVRIGEGGATYAKNDVFRVVILAGGTQTELHSVTYYPGVPESSTYLPPGVYDLEIPLAVDDPETPDVVEGPFSGDWSAYNGNAYSVMLYTENTGGGNATGVVEVDAVGFRLTGQTLGSAGSILDPAPLDDFFDADLLEFVSASPAPTSVSTDGQEPDNGILHWNNIGPIGAGGQEVITVTFRVLNPSNTVQTGVTNTASMTEATFKDGRDAGDMEDSVDVTDYPTASIGGLIWSDLDNGADQDPGEPGIPNVTVFFDDNSNGSLDWTDGDADGAWDQGEGERWVRTDADGRYLFTAIRGPTATYRVRVLTSTLPGGSGTNTRDRDGTPGNSYTDVTLTFGAADEAPADVLDADFGYYGLARALIRGALWNDLDRAGESAPESFEGRLSGVTVFLDADNDGVLDNKEERTTTDAGGNFQFSVAAGTHYVRVLTSTGAMAGKTWTASYDTDGAGTASLVTLSGVGTGRVYNADFSYYTGSASTVGTIYFDLDRDGVQDPEELGIPGVTVRLYVDVNADGELDAEDTLLASTVTGSDGTYTFSGLDAGDYVVAVDEGGIPAGFAQSGDPDESGVCVVCDAQHGFHSAGTGIYDLFGYAPQGSSRIGDFVFYDNNGNGLLDPGEEGIDGVAVRLYLDVNGDGDPDDAGDVLLAQTTTVGGYYRFANLPAPPTGQSYIVKVTPPQEGAVTLAQTADPDRDGVPCSAGGTPSCDDMDSGIVIAATDFSLDSDFGYQPLGTIAGRVWRDQDGDGVQDADEGGLAMVEVRITNGTDTVTVVTDGDGYYSVRGLADGTWTVSLPSPPAGFSGTYDRDGGPDFTSAVVSLAGGGPILDADFGLRVYGPYSLSGTICINDARTLGLCDDVDNFLDDGVDLDNGPDDETELAGVLFFLYLRAYTYGAGGYTWTDTLVATAESDAGGVYTFGNLPANDPDDPGSATDSYSVYRIVIRTTDSPLDNAVLNTTAGQTSADSIDVTATSVIQTVTLLGSSLGDLDLAFSSTVDRDYGDLPAAALTTRLNDDGARHILPAGGSTLYLGTVKPDADPDGCPTAFATGDDTFGTAPDDEDGVVPYRIGEWADGPASDPETGTTGGWVQVTLASGVSGYLLGWIEFDHEHCFTNPAELVVSTAVTGTGSPVTCAFAIPEGTIGAADESWMARFRIVAKKPVLPQFAARGEYTDGEVEDYVFSRFLGSAIGDTVWSDTDSDGVQDSGETGLGGVTVTLTDGVTTWSQVTSDGTQDVDGDGIVDPLGCFRFGNLAAGSYAVSIPRPGGFSYGRDEDGGYDGTIAVTLGADDQHLTADFYLVPAAASISGTVYNDTCEPGNDAIDPDQDQRVAAVAVRLWTDPDGDGDPADGLWVGEEYTTGEGTYVFRNVPAGRYVLIQVDPPGFASEYDTQGSPTDSRIALVLAGTDSTGNDFLDTASADLLAIGGAVYRDGGNGVFGGDDTPVAGVTVQLYIDANGDGDVDSTDPFIQDTLTDANGQYSFGNLPAGTYVVKQVDPLGSRSVNDTQGAPDDSLIAVTLTAADSAGNDFLDDLVPTHAVVGYAAVRLSWGRAVVEWDTVCEVGTVQFAVYRAEAGSPEAAPVTAEPIAAVGEPQGGRYRVLDPDALPGREYAYLIEETDVFGATHPQGPFRLRVPTVEGGLASWGRPVRVEVDPASEPGALPLAEAHPPEVAARADEAPAAASVLALRKPSAKGAAASGAVGAAAGGRTSAALRMKIPVTAEGPCYVSAGTVAAALGLTPAAAATYLKNWRLALSCQGKPVDYVPAAGGAGFYFYARAYRSPYTAVNVYWLEPGAAMPPRYLTARAAGRTPPPVRTSFPETVHAEEDNQAIPSVLARPEDGLWVWGGMIADLPRFDSREVQVDLTDLDSAGGAGLVRVRLHGGTDAETPSDHRVSISVNGVLVGVTEWDGMTPHEPAFPAPAGLLRPGVNRVLLQASLPVSSPASVTYLDWVEITYPRLHVARGNRLVFAATPGTEVTVTGFSSPDIQLFDVTLPGRLSVLNGARVTGQNGQYAATFVVPVGVTRVAAFTPAGAGVVSGSGVPPSVLTARRMGAAHAVIAPAVFAAEAQVLAAHRSASGLASTVVDLTDIYDTFNDGLAEPEAIRAFLRYAYTSWTPPLRYAVLAGEGTYDYRNVLRRNDNLIPPPLAPTPFGLSAADVALGDVDGDGRTWEVAVGRLPAMTAPELAAMIAKVIAYETAPGRTWACDVLLAADAADPGGDFPQDSEALAADLLAGRVLSRVYLSEMPLDAARAQVRAGIEAGTRFLNWIGHGGQDRLSRAGLLTSTDAGTLANAPRLPVLVAATCVVGRFEIPGSDCLGEKLLLRPGGGAVAVWAPSALAYNELSTRLARGFYEAVYTRRERLLGDAVLRSLNAYTAPPSDPGGGMDARKVYNLLGDPATVLDTGL